MNRKTFAIATIFAAFSVAAAIGQTPHSRAAALLTIQTDKPVSKVSPTLYGLMTEEINYSYDGGLYAEMVRNRTLRSDWSGTPDWVLVERGNAAAALALDSATGPSDALKHSLKIDVESADAQDAAGVLNDGYWGMALRPDTTYHGSFYARSTGLDTVTASLVNNQSGQTVATAKVSGVGADWKQYTFVLKTGAAAAGDRNHLELTVAHPGTLWLQLVSLFPPTYHDRANGNRIDLMEKLAAMHPAFLRFPGGNYLEGDRISERFQWKKTIGPLVDRAGHRSPWNYFSTDGMGLLEFLNWCDDLKMQPVLAVYAGYSLMGQHVNPGADLEPYVQDALDELEYVTGGTDTKWGAERTKDGHPQPFHMTYVEIGNEDEFDKSGSYDGRYAQFYKAIKAKYPDLQLIATAPVTTEKPDVLDEHYYVRATQNFHDANHYDKTDRSGPKIFVGEWATREGMPTPNFGAALGDAAWMTGMERNSDIIVMASYAPLLTNVNPGGLQWDPDLIGYNAEKSYGSPSYYAQVLFAQYLGSETLASSVENGGPKFFYSITRDAAKKRLYLKLVNGASTPQTVDVKFAGAGVAATGKLVTLSAHDTQATNSIDEPTRIVPVESTVQMSGGTLHHTMPGYSIQVIAIDQK
jgi:alpha-N-arabinofuranosidase